MKGVAFPGFAQRFPRDSVQFRGSGIHPEANATVRLLAPQLGPGGLELFIGQEPVEEARPILGMRGGWNPQQTAWLGLTLKLKEAVLKFLLTVQCGLNRIDLGVLLFQNSDFQIGKNRMVCHRPSFYMIFYNIRLAIG